MFYNTISLEGKDLQEANVKANSQYELIKEIYKTNPQKRFSPSEILKILERKHKKTFVLTSVRRAISDLTKDNELIKLPYMVNGLYGVQEHQWKYNKPKELIQQQLFK